MLYSPYKPSENGFGANEYPRPDGADITQVHVLHRHGSRYPTEDTESQEWASKIEDNAQEFSGDLSFLNGWSYQLGAELLTANGHHELFDSGILHFFDYGRLYDRSEWYVSRTTTNYRMLESALYFLNGFFGLKWDKKAKLGQIIESTDFNNSLSGTGNCPNVDKANAAALDAVDSWNKKYLADATDRLKKQAGNYDWSVNDTYHAQTMCPYETVAVGYSHFCSLFTPDEWLGFEYGRSIQFVGSAGFSSPIGRAGGIGYVVEFLSRIEGHVVNDTSGPSQVNMTLDSDPVAFPVNQSLYFDFSHDTTITSILTAFGLKQFAQDLPTTGPPSDLQFISSEVIPFATRLVIEIITAPRPVSAKRPKASDESAYDMSQEEKETKYVHFVLNQRTVPLGRSFDECGDRDDGWCELETFLDLQRKSVKQADFEHSCFGDYDKPKYGEVTDGVPPRST